MKPSAMRAAACLAFMLGMSAGEAGAATPDPPLHLRDTGLFVAGSVTEVRAGHLSFSPQYPLWSDGTTKRRWISLPPGSFIDASRADAWEFPRGTRLWKEFALARRIETRYIERLEDGSWRYAVYVWNEDGSDAMRAPAQGIAALPLDAAGQRRYAIPSEQDCRACHEAAAVPVLGFGALQLSPDRDPLAPHADALSAVDLRALVARGLLRGLPQALLDTPPRIAAASPTERAVLGYLHGNCGYCHADGGDTGAAVPVGLRLAQGIGRHGDTAAMLRLLLGAPPRFRAPGTQAPLPLLAAGQSRKSLLLLRMRSREPRLQMPPLGSTLADTEALALVERWIDHELPTRKGVSP